MPLKVLLFGFWSALHFTVMAQPKIDSLQIKLANTSTETEVALINKALGYQYMLAGFHNESDRTAA